MWLTRRANAMRERRPSTSTSRSFKQSIRQQFCAPLSPRPPLPHGPRLPLPIAIPRPLVEQTAIVNRPDILLPHLAILRPQHEVCRHPLENRASPSNRIADIPLPFDLLEQRPNSKIIRTVRVL